MLCAAFMNAVALPATWVSHRGNPDAIEAPDISADDGAAEVAIASAASPCASGSGTNFKSQAGQDGWVLKHLLLHCETGTFVEFGARNGVDHSNTLYYERDLQWKGLLFEADHTQYGDLKANRPGAVVYEGAVCPGRQANLTFGIADSTHGGWSGAVASYEPTRTGARAEILTVKCYNLAEELRRHGMRTVDYMTIDTEGSEKDVVLDFPWDDFDVKVVQIEQLNPESYPAATGKAEAITAHMIKHGYVLSKRYVVSDHDTDDLIYIKEPAPSPVPTAS